MNRIYFDNIGTYGCILFSVDMFDDTAHDGVEKQVDIFNYLVVVLLGNIEHCFDHVVFELLVTESI